MGAEKFSLVVADPAYGFNDKLTMSDVKRGSESNYDVLTDEDIVNLKVKELVADDAILFLWVPSAQLELGQRIVKAWGFRQTQTFVWVKTKQDPFKNLRKDLKRIFKVGTLSIKSMKDMIVALLDSFDPNSILTMNLGRWFRQTHEIALIGVRGKYSKLLTSKDQLSVYISPALLSPKYPHSSKPDGPQDKLDKMMPQGIRKLEMFGRRERDGYVVIGNECPSTQGQDIRESIDNLIAEL